MKVILLDTEKKQPQVIETEGGLEEWYRLLRVRLIDIQSLHLNGVYYDFIADEEGLFHERAKPTVLDHTNAPLIVGNVIICRCNEETGEEIGLTDADISELLKHVIGVKEKPKEDGKEVESWLAICGLEY